MPTEFLPHRREHLFRERVLLAGAEANVQSSGQDIGRHGLFNGGLDRPAAFARILHEAFIFGQRGILRQCHRCQVEQPGTDHAAATPHFGDVGQIQVVTDVFRQFFACGVLENIETFRVGLHDAVLDPIVHHLDEMACSGGPAVYVAFFGSSAELFASGSAWDVASARS